MKDQTTASNFGRNPFVQSKIQFSLEAKPEFLNSCSYNLNNNKAIQAKFSVDLIFLCQM